MYMYLCIKIYSFVFGGFGTRRRHDSILPQLFPFHRSLRVRYSLSTATAIARGFNSRPVAVAVAVETASPEMPDMPDMLPVTRQDSNPQRGDQNDDSPPSRSHSTTAPTGSDSSASIVRTKIQERLHSVVRDASLTKNRSPELIPLIREYEGMRKKCELV